MKNTELASLLRRLERPSGPVDVVLDTDTFNEVDDQFALSYLLASQEKLKVQALYAAPFFNEKSSSPEDGMLKSYEEILRLLKLCHAQELEDRVFQGSRGYLPDEKTPVASPAAEDLARRAMGYSPENPLYVIAIGAITNVASALLLEPAIAEKIVLVWLGGNAWDWPDNHEFNAFQDVAADRVVFGSGAPIVQLPCMGGGLFLPGQRAGTALPPAGQKPAVRLPGGPGHQRPGKGRGRPLLEPSHLGRDRRGLAAGGPGRPLHGGPAGARPHLPVRPPLQL